MLNLAAAAMVALLQSGPVAPAPSPTPHPVPAPLPGAMRPAYVTTPGPNKSPAAPTLTFHIHSTGSQPPDSLQFNLRVAGSGQTPEDAVGNFDTANSALRNALGKARTDDGRFQASYQPSQRYGSAETGFVLERTFTVTTGDLNGAPALVARLLRIPGIKVSNFSYRLADASALFGRAIIDARRDAERQAAALAVPAGLRAVIKGLNAYYQPYTQYNDSILTAPPAQITVPIDVQVDFDLVADAHPAP